MSLFLRHGMPEKSIHTLYMWFYPINAVSALSVNRTVYFQIFRKMQNIMEGADSTIGRQTISSHVPLPKMPSQDSVNQQMEHKNSDVVYRWLSLDEDQRLEYAYSLVDLREQRKKNNYAIKKWKKQNISPEKARKNAAKECKKLFDECAQKESELIDYVRHMDNNRIPYGREYAKQGTAAQNMFREMRSVLYKGDQDVDLVDAQRRIIYDLLGDRIEKYPLFKESVEHRKKLRADIAKDQNCSSDGAKDLIIKPWFAEGSVSQGDLKAKWCYESWCRKEKASHHVRWFSWLKKYHRECHMIRTWLLDNHPKYRDLAKKRKQEKLFDGEEDYRNSEGSALSIFLHTKEWDTLYFAKTWLQKRGWKINGSIHDGCHVRGIPVDTKSLTIAVREHFGYKMTEFDVKSMPDIPDMPMPFTWQGFDSALGPYQILHLDIKYPFPYTHYREGTADDYTVIEFDCQDLTTRSPPISLAFPSCIQTPMQTYKLYINTKDCIGFRHCGLSLPSNLLLGLESRRELTYNETIAMTLVMQHFVPAPDLSCFEKYEQLSLENLVPDGVGSLHKVFDRVEVREVDYSKTDRLPQFSLSGESSTIMIATPPGSGKTSVTKKAVESFEKSNTSTDIVCGNITRTTTKETRKLTVAPSVALHKQLGVNQPEFADYKDGDKVKSSEDLVKEPRLRITPESLVKLSGAKYDEVTFDEFATTISIMCLSSTCNSGRHKRLSMLVKLLRETPHVVILDADLTDYLVQWIMQYRPNAVLYYPVNMQSPWVNYELPSLEHLIRQARYDIDTGKSIFVNSDSKTTIDRFSEALRDGLPNSEHDRIITITSDDRVKDLAAITQQMLTSPRPTLAVLVSPSVVTGVDISHPVFDCVYSHYSGNTISPWQAVQQKDRVRLKGVRGEKKRYVAFGTLSPEEYTDPRTIEKRRQETLDLLKSGSKWTHDNIILMEQTAAEHDRSFEDGEYRPPPNFDLTVHQQFKARTGRLGYLRRLYIAICQKRGETWYRVKKEEDKKSKKRPRSPSRFKKNSRRRKNETFCQEDHFEKDKEAMCNAMCIMPGDYISTWKSTWINVSDFKLRWKRFHALIQGRREVEVKKFDNLSEQVPWECFHAYNEVFSKILCDDGGLLQNFTVWSGAEVPLGYGDTLSKISNKLAKLGGKFRKFRCRGDEDKLKTYTDQYTRLVETVLPLVPAKDGVKGLLTLHKKKLGKKQNYKRVYTYKWNRKEIRKAAANAYYYGEKFHGLDPNDILPQFLKTCSTFG